MSGRPKVCPICQRSITIDEETLPYKNRTAHKVCLTNILKPSALGSEQKNKKTKHTSIPDKQCRISVPVTEEEYKDKRAVISYLEQLTGSKPTAKIYKLLEDYSKKYKFTFSGMLRGLQYYYEVLDHSPEGDCIGIVPYIYDEAQDYMLHLEEVQAANNNVTSAELASMYPTEKIRISRKRDVPSLIDISSII